MAVLGVNDWGVVILAGGLVSDPLASALGTPRKALAVVGGRTCVDLTLDAVRQAGFTDIVVVSGDDVREVVGDEVWIAEQNGQIENARAGVEALPGHEKILFLPADTPFLEPDMILDFIAKVNQREAGQSDHWFAAGVCRYEEFLKILPGFEHPHIRLREGAFMSGAFYATSRRGFFHGADMFKSFSNNRRNQFKMLLRVGIVPLLRYVFHRVTIAEAERTLGRLFGGRAFVITECDPWSMADIDTADEYRRLIQEFNRSDQVR